MTSVGIVVPGEYCRAQGLPPDQFLTRDILTINPELSWRMQDVQYIEPVRTASNYSYHVEHFTGRNFLCVGDSHRFVDPIFSFGVFFAMQEASFAAEAITNYLDGETAGQENPFAEYERRAERGQRVIQDLIDCFWEFPLAFQRMAHHTHQDDVTDMFAGRIYHEDDQLPDGVRTMRRLLTKHLHPASS